jgi:hypothetical protein
VKVSDVEEDFFSVSADSKEDKENKKGDSPLRSMKSNDEEEIQLEFR